MKRFLAIAAIALATMTGGEAQAIRSAADVVGDWGSEAGCTKGAFTYIMREGRLTQIVSDNGKTYTSELRVTVNGAVLKLIDDEKMFTYRIVSPDSIQFIRFTNLENGLSAQIEPRTWHRCR